MNIDDPRMDPVWATAADLRCPTYLHPQPPLTYVRDAYYTGFGEVAD